VPLLFLTAFTFPSSEDSWISGILILLVNLEGIPFEISPTSCLEPETFSTSEEVSNQSPIVPPRTQMVNWISQIRFKN